MTFILSLFLITIIIIGSVIVSRYRQSRNKKLFFKQGTYRSFVYSLAIIIVGGVLAYLISPEKPVNLDFVKLHSEGVTSELSSATGFWKYFLMDLAIFSEMNLIGLLCAILISSIWFYYVRSLDFFSKEKLSYTAAVFILGMIFTLFVFPLSDSIEALFSIEYSATNSFYNLFVYCFVGIGVVEEFVKLLPVLIILFLSNEVDEPIDLIYYACISALAFGFIENLLYFRDLSESVVVGRALTSAVGHMIDSTIVVYGIILYKFRPEQSNVLTLIYYFCLGAMAHALYDHFIFEGLTLLFLGFFIFFIQVWVILINNAVNNSRYFDYSIQYKHDAVKFNLSVFLSILMIVAFCINGLLIGRYEALNAYLLSLGWTSLILIFYIASISSFDLFPGYWRPVKLVFSRPSDQALPGMRGYSTITSIFTENVIVPQNHVTKRINLHCPTYNHHLSEIFHIGSGTITSRLELISKKGKEPDWFMVQLDIPLNVNADYNESIILIKLVNKSASLIHDEHVKCWVKLVPSGVDPDQETRTSEYLAYGFIMLNGEDYVYNV